MEIYPDVQARLLLFSSLLGAVIGAAWEIEAVLLEKIKPRAIFKILRFFADLFFVLTACIGDIVLCYYFNFGQFRAFCALGMLFAFFCCRALLGKALRALTQVILRIISYIIRAVLAPFAKIYKYSVNILEKFIHYIRKGIAKISLWVYNIYVKKSIVRRSRKGFFGDV